MSTKVVAFMSPKGGTGKSTLATNAAAWLAREGEPVVLADLDPQGSALVWGRIRGEHEHTVDVRQMTAAQLEQVVGRLRSAGQKAWIVVDTPPHNLSILANVAKISDAIVVPFRPSRFDIEALKGLSDLAKANRIPDSRFRSIVNGIPTHHTGRAGAEKAAEIVKKLYGWLSAGVIAQRVSYGYATDSGLDIAELAPADRGVREIKIMMGLIKLTANAQEI